MSQYKGKSVLVTGAQQGIGRSMVLNFAKEGANVAVNWHNDEQKALSVAKEAAVFGVKVELVKGDVSVVEEARNIVAQVEKKFGKIDVLINNAGMFPRVPLLDMEESDWDFVLNINLKGTFFVCRLPLSQCSVTTYRELLSI